MDLAKLIEGANKHGASDIHLMEDASPYFRLHGDIMPVKGEPLSHQEMMDLLKKIMPERLVARLERERGADFSYQHKDIVRARLVAFYERQRLRMVFRLIPLNIPTIEEMDLPPALKKLSNYPRGMVLVTGPTGSGKSSTLAAVLNELNETKNVHVITVEDPIEFMHPNKKAIFCQREVGDDVEDFNDGLIQAMRQDPDVILVGEMRDIGTMRTAIRAAQTGHLVFSTLHTTSAVQSMERIISTFPQDEHRVLLDELAANMRAIIAQTLVRRAGGKGRVAALEIMVANTTVAKLIFDNRIQDIVGVMRAGEDDMQVLDQALANLVRAKAIDYDEGARYATDNFAFRRYVKGVTSSSDSGGIIGGFSG